MAAGPTVTARLDAEARWRSRARAITLLAACAVLSGGNNMPAYGEILQPDEVSALVAFLQTRISR